MKFKKKTVAKSFLLSLSSSQSNRPNGNQVTPPPHNLPDIVLRKCIIHPLVIKAR